MTRLAIYKCQQVVGPSFGYTLPLPQSMFWPMPLGGFQRKLLPESLQCAMHCMGSQGPARWEGRMPRTCLLACLCSNWRAIAISAGQHSAVGFAQHSRPQHKLNNMEQHLSNLPIVTWMKLLFSSVFQVQLVLSAATLVHFKANVLLSPQNSRRNFMATEAWPRKFVAGNSSSWHHIRGKSLLVDRDFSGNINSFQDKPDYHRQPGCCSKL